MLVLVIIPVYSVTQLCSTLCDPVGCSLPGSSGNCNFPCLCNFPGKNWNGEPSPTPGNLHDPGTEPRSLASPALAGRLFTTRAKLFLLTL